MKVREERVFKVPVDELRAMLEKQYGVDLAGVDPYLEENHVVFAVGYETDGSTRPEALPRQLSQAPALTKPARARRRRRKRNRIKTRGWNVVAKITNSKGLVANIYEPLVKALEGRAITKAEQRRIVRQLLVANGNSPKEESVDYFLENTLEYLARKEVGVVVADAN